MSTETVHGIEAGEIRRATITYRLADGSHIQQTQRILLLDVRPAAPAEQDRMWQHRQPIRVLWRLVDEEMLPVDEPRWDDLVGGGAGTTTGAVWIAGLHEPVGVYQPRDPDSNSLEILRDYAIARVTALSEWRHGHHPVDVAEASALRRAAEKDLRRARAHEHELVRAALGRGVSASDLAYVTGLRPARIYQIRDGRR